MLRWIAGLLVSAALLHGQAVFRPPGGGGVPAGSVVSGTWGSIDGTLSDQLDLQVALDLKEAADADLTTIASLACPNGQIIKRTAGVWGCADDEDAGGAPTDATYITQTANGTLTAEQALSALATGILKSTTGTGVISIGVPDTDFAAASHAARHKHGGADEVATATPGANAIPKAEAGGTLNAGWIPDLSGTYQPTDADLTALAALAGTGLVARTGAGTYAERTITGDAEITVADGPGVAGNPTLAIAAALMRDAEWTAATLTAQGKVELATGAETNTGTDATRAVTPDGLDDWTGSAQVASLGADAVQLAELDDGADTPLVGEWLQVAAGATQVQYRTDAEALSDIGAAASTHYHEAAVELVVFDFATDNATGDGKYYFVVPSKINAWNLTAVSAQVVTTGTTGTLNMDLARCDVVAAGNMCSGTVQDMLSTNLTIDTGEGRSSTAATPAVINATYDDVDTDEVIRIDIDAVHTTEAKGLIVNLKFEKP